MPCPYNRRARGPMVRRRTPNPEIAGSSPVERVFLYFWILSKLELYEIDNLDVNLRVDLNYQILIFNIKLFSRFIYKLMLFHNLHIDLQCILLQ